MSLSILFYLFTDQALRANTYHVHFRGGFQNIRKASGRLVDRLDWAIREILWEG